MKIACLSFTDKGKILGNMIVDYSIQHKGRDEYTVDHYINDEVPDGIKNILDFVFREYDGLVFISATGIAVRMISPYIKNKALDPAVVVVDDLGKFSISLLSGHIGGGNKLANWIGKLLGAIPVITTASDNRGIESIDIFAMKNDYHMEDMESMKKITSMMVNGKRIGFYSEMDKIIGYNNLVILEDLDYIDPSIDGLIIVSSQKLKLSSANKQSIIEKCRLIPKNINIGIGCRKGVDSLKIIKTIEEEFDKANLSTKGIKSIGTVEIKKDEQGIIEAAEYFNCPLKIFTLDEIKEVEDRFEKSQFVKDTIGIYSVSEPCAYLLGGNILSYKTKHNGITISIAKEDIHG